VDHVENCRQRDASFAMRLTTVVVGLLILAVSPAWAADLTVDEIRSALAVATPAKPADFSGKSLEELDLSNLDLSGANFANANMRAVKLDGAKLRGTNLSGAILNLAWVMRADFTDANLSRASFQGPVVAPGLEISMAHAPIFTRTNFSGARIVARFSRFDLRGADFSGAQMGVDMRNQSMGLMRTDFTGANLEGASFAGADLGRALLSWANLRGVSFRGARLRMASFVGADLRGADLTDADAAGATFEKAKLEGATGLGTVKGLRVGAE
jgi:uncharacterized protein YjbI with pentapeptide repeats